MMKLRTRVANERLSKTHKHFDTARTLLERLQILEMYYLGLITAALTFSAEKQSSKLNIYITIIFFLILVNVWKHLADTSSIWHNK